VAVARRNAPVDAVDAGGQRAGKRPRQGLAVFGDRGPDGDLLVCGIDDVEAGKGGNRALSAAFPTTTFSGSVRR
jgi:hypothetical protein